ncbi:universal stress protein [Nesterenkonia alkaliphila]|uniref:Universal stress protein n=1 Tax=Nesterenkonia alkaliphila TaxID=1463631 RepID=A0A7K1UIM6_9MICC|nr:universal stress protein [Nesterenkonia alkaliphila]MVT26335.1 universal stress protein [Nesterenkonia alkaliphila]GFZ88462.1 universal stress protein UspA [Nesterenkonia alkaliphila]
MTKDVRTQVPAPQGSIPYSSENRALGVLVGFDGSQHATLALHYAARAAQRLDAPLTVVSAYTVPVGVYSTLASLPDMDEARIKKQMTEGTLDGAREYLKDYPGQVSYRAEGGDAAGVLVELSEQARLVVVGARGRGGFLGRLLGSVASALPAHAKAPTVVVPRHYRLPEAEGPERFAPTVSEQPVAVGIDGSEESRIAALQAAQAATDRGVALRLIVALPPIDGALLWYPELAPRGAEVGEIRKRELSRTLSAEAEWISRHFPELTIEETVEVGEPTGLLTAASRTSQLTVVGTRGRGGVASALLGSVSRNVLYNAEGPVMVVPKLEDPRLEDQPVGW